MFQIGSIYSITYTTYKTNPNKIYIFVLYGAPAGGKVHALNINARQLNTIDKAKLVRIIVKLSKVKTATKYNGMLLYKIFKTYLRNETSKCYRTYISQNIIKSALLNYGLNSEEDFSDLEKSFQNEQLYKEAQRDFLIRSVNLASGRGAKLSNAQNNFAKIIQPNQEENTNETNTEADVVNNENTDNLENTDNENTETTDDNSEEPEGYY